MNIQPSIDLKKVNLQTAVGYLISLHENEYEWNLLGIKVIGVAATVDDIPVADYEFGDAYEIGTETPYDLYVYTRPDGKVHTEGYWFNLGKFPLPGPKGDKGNGWETARALKEAAPGNITYNSTTGGTTAGFGYMTYTDHDTGKTNTQTFSMESKLPIVPGKYINIDATSDHKKLEVKVDDTDLALDFYKVNKGSEANVPAYSPAAGVISVPYSYLTKPNSLVRRGAQGEVDFDFFNAQYWRNPDDQSKTLYFSGLYAQCGTGRGSITVTKTTSDTGLITAGTLAQLQSLPQTTIQYDNKTFYRQDPLTAPDGTLNYIHIDAVQNGSGGYKGTGQCFSITKSTRAWQVVDIDFTGTNLYNHYITITDSVTGNVAYLNIVSTFSKPYTHATLPTLLKSQMRQGTFRYKDSDNMNTLYAANIRADAAPNYIVIFKNMIEFYMTTTQATVSDSVIPC